MPIVWTPPQADSPVQTAGNGLTLNGSEIDLGGTLTEDTDIETGGNAFTVDGVSIIPTVTGADNGLSVSFGNVELGGTLNHAATILIPTGHFLNIGRSSWFEDESILGGGLSGAQVQTGVSASSNNVNFAYDDSVLGEQSIFFDGALMLIKDTILMKGVTYDNDYSANYTVRSLPDVAYLIAQITNAINTNIINTPQAAMTSTITFTATTPPSGATNHTFEWNQTGKMVTVRFNLIWAVAGVAVTNMNFPFPAGLPLPMIPAGLNAANTNLYTGAVAFASALTGLGFGANGRMLITTNSTNTGFNIDMFSGTDSAITAFGNIIYFVP